MIDWIEEEEAENTMCPICGARMYLSFDGYHCPPLACRALVNSDKANESKRSNLLHCQHCEDEGGLKYKGWDHHCFMESAGYIKWNDGECPLCLAALTERAAIVKWLRHQSEPGTSAVRPIGSIADQIELGEHND